MLFRVVITLMVVASIIISILELHGALRLSSETFRVPPAVIYSQYLIAVASGLLAVLLAWTSLQLSGVTFLVIHLVSLSLGHALMIDSSGSPGFLHRGSFTLFGALAVVAFVRYTSEFPRELKPAELVRAKAELPLVLIRWLRRADESSQPWFFARVWRGLQSHVVSTPRTVWLAGIAYAILIYWMHANYGSPYSMVMFHLSDGTARACWALFVIVFMFAIFIGLSNLRVNYAYSAPEQQRRILWLTQGYVSALFVLTFAIAMGLVAVVAGNPVVWRIATDVAFVAWPLAVLTVLACFFTSIFFSGVFDPALVLRKTSLYATMVIVMVFLFAGVESLLQSRLTAWLGLPENVSVWIGGGVIALLVGPLHSWLKIHVARLAGVEDSRK